MKMTTMEQDKMHFDSFVEISRKEADSIGISEGELLKIPGPFHYSESAVGTYDHQDNDPAAACLYKRHAP